MQNPAKGDHGDAADEANILKDIVGLDTLASTSQLTLKCIRVNATVDVLSDTRAAAVEQFVSQALVVANSAVAGAAVYTPQREG